MEGKKQSEVAGLLKKYKKDQPVSTEAMDKGIEQYLKRKGMADWDEWFDNPQVTDDFMPKREV